MKTLYIIRHGETDYNLAGKVQGSGIDSDINETGYQQSESFFEFYKSVPFEKVYHSPLKRTKQSIQKFIDLGIPTQAHPGIIEICWGFHEGKTTLELDPTYYSWLIEQWNSGNTHIQIRDGDSPEELQQRQKEFLEHVLQSPENLILICMHGRAMRIFLSLLLETPLAKMDMYKHQNTCLYVLKQSPDGKWQVEVNNSLAHLDFQLIEN